jgi:hypothetical protein
MVLSQTTASDAQILKARNVGKEKYLSIALIQAADQSKYSRLMDDLVSQNTMGHNCYQLSCHRAVDSATHK